MFDNGDLDNGPDTGGQGQLVAILLTLVGAALALGYFVLNS